MSEQGATSGSEPARSDPARPGPARSARRRRGLLRPLLLVGVPLLVALALLYWYAVSGRYVTTENAYVKSDIVTISADIDGRVVSVEVADNQQVAQGDVLFRIDPEPFRIALDMADANILTVRHDIEAARAEFRQIEAEIDEARERVKFFQQQALRQRELEQRGIAAEVRLEEAELELAAARQRVTALREKLRTVLARLGGDPASAAELHPAFIEAESRRDMAALDLADTVVRAPVDGYVSRMRLQPGEWLEAGEAAFTIIDPQATWIEANLKETQLTHVEVGQRVEVEVDAYPDQVWQGEVASISPATGAEFALIPPQNATGNWVKVVQRLPVRIAVEAPDGQPPLRAGMTVAVRIDTEREPRLAEFVRKAVASVSGGP
jgi:membrane fusion protein (multidrug efflux system)